MASEAEIRRVATANELRAVYRLRYAVCVGELGRNEPHADHAEKLLVDPLDAPEAVVFGAWEGGRLAGTVRVSLVRYRGVGSYLDYYQLDRLPAADLDRLSITTRLMVHPDRRGTPLALGLACACYRLFLEEGVEADYCDCDPGAVPFFRRLGYEVHRADFVHPQYGPGPVLRLDVLGLDHLARCRSPFRRLLEAWRAVRDRSGGAHD